jgi:hypothetical protein
VPADPLPRNPSGPLHDPLLSGGHQGVDLAFGEWYLVDRGETNMDSVACRMRSRMPSTKASSPRSLRATASISSSGTWLARNPART